jgi:beta-galactosidase GanA
LEGKQGSFTAEGVFALEQFFDAASEAGIYLVARPGPYIDAEAYGGGFPGWLGRTKELERTPDYITYTQNYIQGICGVLAPAQIT